MSASFGEGAAVDEFVFKACCAAAYQASALVPLLGESWRPGGASLTEEIARQAGVNAGDRVLDVACGIGDSVRTLAQRFDCTVVGLDLSAANLGTAARRTAEREPGPGAAAFVAGDAESLPLASASFDLVLSECALCTFPDKGRALREAARVLRPGGRLAIADVTLEPGSLPEDLETLAGRVVCVADALPLGSYVALAEEAGLTLEGTWDRQQEALAVLKALDGRLLLARIGQAVGKFGLEGFDIREARRLLKEVMGLVEAGTLSYAYLIARLPA